MHSLQSAARWKWSGWAQLVRQPKLINLQQTKVIAIRFVTISVLLYQCNGTTIHVSFLADAPLHINCALFNVPSRKVATMDLDEAVVAVVCLLSFEGDREQFTFHVCYFTGQRYPLVSTTGHPVVSSSPFIVPSAGQSSLAAPKAPRLAQERSENVRRRPLWPATYVATAALPHVLRWEFCIIKFFLEAHLTKLFISIDYIETNRDPCGNWTRNHFRLSAWGAPPRRSSARRFRGARMERRETLRLLSFTTGCPETCLWCQSAKCVSRVAATPRRTRTWDARGAREQSTRRVSHDLAMCATW